MGPSSLSVILVLVCSWPIVTLSAPCRDHSRKHFASLQSRELFNRGRPHASGMCLRGSVW